MTRYRNWKRLLLLVTGTAMLATIVWAAYLFTAIWLRVRCARQLAARAEPLPVINLLLEPVGPKLEATAGTAASFGDYDGDGWADVWVASSTASEIDSIMDRLEALQRPGFPTVWKQLWGRRAAPTSASQDLVYSILVRTPVSNGSLVDTTVAVLDSSESMLQTVTLEPQSELLVSGAADVDADGNPVTLTLTTRTAVRLWGPGPRSQCFSATDSAGEKLWIVTRSPQTSPDDSTSEPTLRRPSQELLLVDSSGRIYARLESPRGALLGKLPEPLGMADQLVFGSAASVWDAADGSLLRRRTSNLTVSIIEKGMLKTVRELHLPFPPRPSAVEREAEEISNHGRMPAGD